MPFPMIFSDLERLSVTFLLTSCGLSVTAELLVIHIYDVIMRVIETLNFAHRPITQISD